LKRSRRRVLFRSDSADALRRVCGRKAEVETGGILVGYREGRDIVVVDVVEVPDWGASFASYTRDSERAQELLDVELAAHQPASHLGYVGEWHTHLLASSPSEQDLRELRSVAKLAGGPVALLVVLPPRSKWDLTLKAWIAARFSASPAGPVFEDGGGVGTP
jgi:integrative and conjugative element protein (TIGR02256 family)